MQGSLSNVTHTSLSKARRSQSSLTVPWELQIFWPILMDANMAYVNELLLHAGGGEFHHAFSAVVPAPSTTHTEN